MVENPRSPRVPSPLVPIGWMCLATAPGLLTNNLSVVLLQMTRARCPYKPQILEERCKWMTRKYPSISLEYVFLSATDGTVLENYSLRNHYLVPKFLINDFNRSNQTSMCMGTRGLIFSGLAAFR